MLDGIRTTIDTDWSQLHKYAERVAEEFDDGGWCVDFLRDSAGNWYAADMALYGLYWDSFTDEDGQWRELSYHADGCPHNLEEQPPDDLPDDPQNGRERPIDP